MTKYICAILIAFLFLCSIPVHADTTSSSALVSDPVFDTALAGLIGSIVNDMSWSAGYIRSINNPDKQGADLQATRTLYNLKIKKYTIPLEGNFIMVTSANSKPLYGLGFSANFKAFVPCDLGIAYIPGGYKWSVSLQIFSKAL